MDSLRTSTEMLAENSLFKFQISLYLKIIPGFIPKHCTGIPSKMLPGNLQQFFREIRLENQLWVALKIPLIISLYISPRTSSDFSSKFPLET